MYTFQQDGREVVVEMKPEIIAELTSIVGEKNMITSYEDLFCFAYDASFVYPDMKKDIPGAVVFPHTAEEISRILKIANREKIPVIPRGSGTNVTGGTVSIGDAIIVNLTRMNKILEIDRKNLVAVIEPGVITGQFQQEVEKLGLYYPPDPASLAVSTMGGNVAECAGGPHGVKYGVTKDYVLGLEIVIPTGEILYTGGKTLKNVTGYDMTKLFTGCEGTLGIITKIIVKLIPLPEAKKTMMAIFSELDDASEAVAEIIAGGVIPTTLELLDNIYIRNIEEYVHIGLPVDAEALLLIEVDGDPDILDKQIKKIETICMRVNAVRIDVAQTPEEANDLWRARRSAFGSLARLAPTIIGEDATVPRNKIPVLVKKTREIAKKYDLTIAILGHAGDGNLHATILADEQNKEQMARVDKAASEIFQATVELGGSLSGEHGIGRGKSKFITMQIGETGLEVQRRIKLALDPNNILNPGVMFGE